jgi:effector-binding domain-containing protein
MSTLVSLVPVTAIRCKNSRTNAMQCISASWRPQVPPRERTTVTAYDVSIERTAECPTAVVKANTTWREFRTLWPTLLDEVWALLRSTPGLRTEGHNVMLYRHTVPGVEAAVEVGVQVTGSFTAAGRVVPSTLPAVEAAATVHGGVPAEIGAAHSAVRAWCSAQGREVTGVSWEIYGDPDPQTGHFDVAVYWELT